MDNGASRLPLNDSGKLPRNIDGQTVNDLIEFIKGEYGKWMIIH